MKNFIEQGSADCIKVVGYTSARKTGNNAKKSLSIKNILPEFYISFKGHSQRLSSCCYKVFFCFIILMLVKAESKAQQDLSYALHANIIYRFTKYIDWPNGSGDFVIGIVGDTPLYDELESFIVNKTVGNRKIVVKKMSSSADSYNCQILFISEDKSKSLKKIAELTSATSTLIVSESSGLALKGSCINFVIVNDHLKLEINKNNIIQRNLNIANELLGLGVVVKN